MRIILLCSLLFLTSCVLSPTSPTNQKPVPTQTPSTGAVATVSTQTKTVTTPTYGTGKMQVEIFADFQCPACIVFADNIQPIFESYAASGKLTMVFRQFPLTNIHKNAMGDALAALCSAEQGKYMEYKKGLYALEKEKSGKTVTDDERVALAKELGMDETKFFVCLSSRAYEKQIESDMAKGESQGLEGTPTIYIDGMKVDMSLFRDLEGFKSFLDSRIK